MCSWKRLDVKEDKEYYVVLCQSPDGKRDYELCEKGSEPNSKNAIFRMEVVPFELLWWKRFEEISNTIKLTNGKRFYVEAHGVWFTEEENEVLSKDFDDENVPWLNGLAPLLPPM